MTRRLPPLNALKAFEAAGRRLSFSKAAEELHVTPAAVSHQIKTLEELLGVPLFRRATRVVHLTEAGRRALPLVSDGLDRLDEAIQLVREHEAAGELRVTVPTTFAARWLVPRLHRFSASRPDINVRIDANNNPVDLLAGEADIAVRYGSGDYRGLVSEPFIAGETIAPFCSPCLLTGKHPLKRPEDLCHHTLIHLEVEQLMFGWPTWDMWLKAAGVEGVASSSGPVFAQHEMAINAAIAGQGVVLASLLFIEPEIAAGRLVIPFDVRISTGFGYFLVGVAESLKRPKVAAFRNWLLEEATSP
jgi:LysR family glycine cleavage system transcriptional activator